MHKWIKLKWYIQPSPITKEAGHEEALQYIIYSFFKLINIKRFL